MEVPAAQALESACFGIGNNVVLIFHFFNFRFLYSIR